MNTKGSKMKKILVLSVLALTGCASIVDGGPDTINLMTSNGASVKAQINSKQFGTQQITLYHVYFLLYFLLIYVKRSLIKF